nr:tripartite motif-containing protein 26 [Syngnathus scovelli]
MVAGGSSYPAAFSLSLLLASICLQLDARGAEQRADDLMEVERWRYGSHKKERWSRFRDDDYVRNAEDSLTVNENEALGYSGHFGSGVGWEDQDEKELKEEEQGEEEEEEADDGGYIW